MWKYTNKIAIAKILAILIIIIGITVAISWVFDIDYIKSPLGRAQMKFNTALSFVLSGIGLFFMARAKEGKESVARIVLTVLAFFIFFLMTNLLLTYFVSITTGIESLFVKEGETPFPTLSLGALSIPTILNFIMIGTSFILFSLDRSKKIIEGTGIAVLISGVIAVIGHIINSPPLFFLVKDVSSGMAIHTSTLFVIVSSVIIFLQRQTVQELKKDDAEVLSFVRNNVSSSQEMMAMWTNSSSIAYTMTLLFNYIWSSSKNMENNS